jgi:hypothetical protein
MIHWATQGAKMPFNDFPDVERVKIETKTGAVVGPYRALFSGKTIILDGQAEVDEGDVVIRKLPNGRDERCHVTYTEFCNGMDGIEAYYNVTFRKGSESGVSASEAPKPSTTFNIHGGQVQIGDHNTQNIVNALQELKRNIDKADASPDEKQQASGLLRSLLAHPLVTSILGGLAGSIV